MPFTGEYNSFYEQGTYTCKRCGAALYESSSKFNSSCGWPSFDDEIEGAVKHVPDADGRRTEIVCNNCDAATYGINNVDAMNKWNNRSL